MPKGVNWKTAKATAPYRDATWLHDQYWGQMRSTPAIAETCGADTKTIFYWLRKHGIPIRTKQSSQIGSLGNNWQGGVSERTWRRVAFLAHGNRCQNCGHGGRLEVHHLDRDQTNNNPNNLRVLCRSCHKLLHFAEDPEIRLKMSRSAKHRRNARKEAS